MEDKRASQYASAEQCPATARKPAARADKLLFYLSKGANKAIRDYRMIEDGDRIAVAVSGGKDSLTLLRLLVARQAVRPEKYEVVAIHVTSDAEECGGPVDRAALEAHLQEYGIAYQFVPLETASGQPQRRAQSPCFHCSWRRRKALFQAAEQLGCNKVAFGHHADDLAETTLLNLCFQGRVETMEPRRAFFDERLTVIRPLAYIEEKEIMRYARVAGFPPPPRRCLGEDRSRRELMHQMIEQLRLVDPRVKINLFRAAACPLPQAPSDSEDDQSEE